MNVISNVDIPVPHGQLEAIFEEPEGAIRGSALLCHPHPQYGGSMHTKGVYYAAEALRNLGLETLRFNFRGVGASTGQFEGGSGERNDAKYALKYLKENGSGGALVLQGFSFGASIGLRVGQQDRHVDSLVGMGLAVSLDSFDFLQEVDRPTLVIQGENDQFGDRVNIQDTIRKLNGNITLKIIRGTGHLFTDRYNKLKNAIKDFFRQGAGTVVFQ